MTVENYALIANLSTEDVEVLEHKGKTYGNSWRKRGGVGAFMMLCRKWDRIENICKERGWDIFDALRRNEGDIQDDIRDLRRYLLLLDAHVIMTPELEAEPFIDTSEPQSRGYVDQD